MQIATFAAGCFWNVEAAFRKLPGVTKTQAGYTGGTVTNPIYEQVCSHTTGHAEAVQITFDPQRISYRDLLDEFWRVHDPTQLNRQGPDVGSSYRSAIFYHTSEQKQLAETSKTDLANTQTYTDPIVTEIVQAGDFYPAEDYHQQYLEKRGLATCAIELHQGAKASS